MKIFTTGRFDRGSLLRRILLVLGINLIYVLIFITQYPTVGDSIGSLSILPTAITGGLLGLRLGIIGGLFNFLVNESLYGFLSPNVDIFSLQSLPGLAFSIGSSAVVGWLSDLLNHTRDQADRIEQQSQALQKEIANRIQAEAVALQARDRAYEASQVKSRILASVSHDLRTPMTAIVGYTEMLHEGELGELSEAQKRVAGRVLESATYLLGLVSELLDQAQFEAVGVNLVISSYSLRELMQQIQTRMNILAQAKGLKFQLEIDSEMPDKLVGDESRLQQIILNLAGNAIKFTEKGLVHVRISLIDQDSWAIQVKDTGIGITQAAQSNIFEPFHKAENANPSNRTGAGLGLSIVKNLTEAMNGEITVESTLGQGSTFTVTLPLMVEGSEELLEMSG